MRVDGGGEGGWCESRVSVINEGEGCVGKVGQGSFLLSTSTKS